MVVAEGTKVVSEATTDVVYDQANHVSLELAELEAALELA